jgi:hypothetical protein
MISFVRTAVLQELPGWQAAGQPMSGPVTVRHVYPVAADPVLLWLPGGAESYWLATHDSVRRTQLPEAGGTASEAVAPVKNATDPIP